MTENARTSGVGRSRLHSTERSDALGWDRPRCTKAATTWMPERPRSRCWIRTPAVTFVPTTGRRRGASDRPACRVTTPRRLKRWCRGRGCFHELPAAPRWVGRWCLGRFRHRRVASVDYCSDGWPPAPAAPASPAKAARWWRAAQPAPVDSRTAGSLRQSAPREETTPSRSDQRSRWSGEDFPFPVW